jgi:hypothetical protein
MPELDKQVREYAWLVHRNLKATKNDIVWKNYAPLQSEPLVNLTETGFPTTDFKKSPGERLGKAALVEDIYGFETNWLRRIWFLQSGHSEAAYP